MAAAGDIVTRLRDAYSRSHLLGDDDVRLWLDAANEIERLRAQIDDFDDEMRVAMERAED